MVRARGPVRGFYRRRVGASIGRSAPSNTGLTEREIERVAPNLAASDMLMYLLRPTPGMSNPPLCTLHELRTVYTLDDLANFHELLDLQEAAGDKAARSMRDKQDKQKGRR